MTATFWRAGDTAYCTHCGDLIVFVELLAGAVWTHRHDGLLDGDHVFCHVTQAEPIGEVR